ncbi:PerC family transcriptional regulator [Escherichia coli]|nr:PerC family transcriptional regulator [Escherichia coli]
MVRDKKAEDLEQRGLWRRAAARWQEVLMDYRQEGQVDQRIYVREQIRRCTKLAASKNIAEKNVSTSKELRKAAIRIEKEMGIHRDRKKAHGELYVHRKK